MLPSQVRAELISCCEAAGLTRSASPVSVLLQPSTAAHRAFNVLPVSDRSTVGSREKASGHMVFQSDFTVEIVHKMTAARGRGDDAMAVALDDQVAVLQAVWDPAAALNKGNTRVGYGGTSRQFLADGDFHVARMAFQVIHHVPLTAGGDQT